MKLFLLLLTVLTTTLAATAENHKKLDSLTANDHVTITFYKELDCKDAAEKKVTLSCTNDFSNTVNKYALDTKAVDSTCVSGKFASYKISNQRHSTEKLALIGVTKGESKCSFKGNKAVKTFKPSVMDFVSGGCHNLGSKAPSKCSLPLGVDDNAVYTYQCTRGWPQGLEKRGNNDKSKGNLWKIDGQRSDRSVEGEVLKKRGKGNGAMWTLEGALKACKTKDKDGKCKDLPPKIKGRSDESVDGEQLEKRFKHDKGEGNAWPIEGAKKHCKKIGKDGNCEDQPPTLNHRSDRALEQEDAVNVLLNKRNKGWGPGWKIEGKGAHCKHMVKGQCLDHPPIIKLRSDEDEDVLEKRDKGKDPGWKIEGKAKPCKHMVKGHCQDQPPTIKIRSDENQDVLEKRNKGKGNAWPIEGLTCEKDKNGKCKGTPPVHQRSDETVEINANVLEKRRKGKGAMWVIEGMQVPADPSLFCDYWVGPLHG